MGANSPSSQRRRRSLLYFVRDLGIRQRVWCVSSTLSAQSALREGSGRYILDRISAAGDGEPVLVSDAACEMLMPTLLGAGMCYSIRESV